MSAEENYKVMITDLNGKDEVAAEGTKEECLGYIKKLENMSGKQLEKNDILSGSWELLDEDDKKVDYDSVEESTEELKNKKGAVMTESEEKEKDTLEPQEVVDIPAEETGAEDAPEVEEESTEEQKVIYTVVLDDKETGDVYIELATFDKEEADKLAEEDGATVVEVPFSGACECGCEECEGEEEAPIDEEALEDELDDEELEKEIKESLIKKGIATESLKEWSLADIGPGIGRVLRGTPEERVQRAERKAQAKAADFQSRQAILDGTRDAAAAAQQSRGEYAKTVNKATGAANKAEIQSKGDMNATTMRAKGYAAGQTNAARGAAAGMSKAGTIAGRAEGTSSVNRATADANRTGIEDKGYAKSQTTVGNANATAMNTVAKGQAAGTAAKATGQATQATLRGEGEGQRAVLQGQGQKQRSILHGQGEKAKEISTGEGEKAREISVGQGQKQNQINIGDQKKASLMAKNAPATPVSSDEEDRELPGNVIKMPERQENQAAVGENLQTKTVDQKLETKEPFNKPQNINQGKATENLQTASVDQKLETKDKFNKSQNIGQGPVKESLTSDVEEVNDKVNEIQSMLDELAADVGADTEVTSTEEISIDGLDDIGAPSPMGVNPDEEIGEIDTPDIDGDTSAEYDLDDEEDDDSGEIVDFLNDIE